MKKQILLLFCCLAGLAFQAAAQRGTFLKGKVTDKGNKEPLIGCNIKVDGFGATTDMDGNFSIKLEDEGTYKVEITYLGYETIRKTFSIEEGETVTLNFEMAEESTMLQETTVTSSKFEKPLGEVTVSLDIIKPRLSDNINATQVTDVVQKVPGVNFIDGQANIRGGSGYSYGAGSRVLLLMDDLPIMQGDAGFPNWTDLPVENLDQIEVVKGASSALYGSSALNGIINVRTAYAKSDPVYKFSVFGTTFDYPAQLDSAGTKINNDWWRNSTSSPSISGASFAFRQRFGRKFDVVVGSYIFNDNNFKRGIYDRKMRVNTKLTYHFTDKIQLSVGVNINRGQSSSFLLQQGSFSYAFFPTGQLTETRSLRYAIDPSLTIRAGEWRHKILGRYFYVNNENTNNQGNQSSVSYLEYQAGRTLDFYGPMSVVGGIVGTHTEVQAQLYGGGKFNTQNAAAYIQFDKKFFGKLNVSFGARYEHFWMNSPDTIVTGFSGGLFGQPLVQERGKNSNPAVSEGRPVFRLGMNYQPADYTYIRASVGQGYRFPTIAEKFIATAIPVNAAGTTLPLQIRANPDLQSETGWSAEIGIKQGLKIGSGWKGYADASIFYTEYSNMMEFTFGGRDVNNPFLGFQSVNIGNTVIAGFDFTLLGQGKIGNVTLNTLMGYTFIDPKYKEFEGITDAQRNDATFVPSNPGQANAYYSSSNDNVLKYRFRHTFKFDMEASYKSASAGLSVQYNSFMDAVDNIFENGSPAIGFTGLSGVHQYRTQYKDKGIAIVDFRCSYKVTDNFKVSFLVKNLFNEFYYLRPALPEAPRNFTIRLDYAFGE